MGKIATIVKDRLIPPTPDRSANRIYIYHKQDNLEVSIHFRNLKITLADIEVEEWKRGFKEALKTFLIKNYLENDV